MRPITHGKSRFSLLFALLSALVLLAGCAGGGGGPDAPPPDQSAQRLLAAGQSQSAGQEWLRLAADADKANGVVFRTSAANAFLLAGNTGAARKALAGLPAAGLVPDAEVRAALARARLAALDGQRQLALAMLPSASIVPPGFTRVHLLTRIEALPGSNRHIELAQAHHEYGALLNGANERQENDTAIWDALSAATSAELDQALLPPPDIFGGWVELARIDRQYSTNADALASALAVWSAQYPGHPGNLVTAPAITASAARLSRPARHVALMLPVSGPLQSAGVAVRDGFVAAWLQSGMSNSVRLSVLDTNGEDAGTIYRSAIAGGVDFVVGPLRKNAVQQVMAQPELPVPTLALNAFPPPPNAPATLYQMALAPEQEAQQVAKRIWFDGHQQVLVIGPSSDWGKRVTDAFTNAFASLGGTILESQFYDAESRDMSEPVKRLLNIDLSDQRARSLRRFVRAEVKSEVRRRQDVDAIFMASFAAQARSLRPQLRFHRASKVPVYATSHVYGGSALAERDSDINGVLFGDMPWVLLPPERADPLKREMGEQWSRAMAGFSRLIAFGADAQAMVTRLTRLRATPGSEFAGQTGTLSVDGQNIVRRKLTWARFQDGLPTLIDDINGTGGTSPSQ
jgi:uncharacterized protein